MVIFVHQVEIAVFVHLCLEKSIYLEFIHLHVAKKNRDMELCSLLNIRYNVILIDTDIDVIELVR